MLTKFLSFAGAAALVAGCFGGPSLEGSYQFNKTASNNQDYIETAAALNDVSKSRFSDAINAVGHKYANIEINGDKVKLGPEEATCDLSSDKEFVCKEIRGKLRFEDDFLVVTFQTRGEFDVFYDRQD